MKPFPTRKIRRLIKELVESVEDAPRLGFRFRMEGAWDVDQDGEIGLSAEVKEALPDSVPVDGQAGVQWKRTTLTEHDGIFLIEIWRDPPGEPSADS